MLLLLLLRRDLWNMLLSLPELLLDVLLFTLIQFQPTSSWS